MFCIPKNRPIDPTLEYTKYFAKTTKVLLLGTGESGKTTIIKQMKILHINGFSVEELKAKIPFIKQNVHESMFDILSNMKEIKPPVEIYDKENLNSYKYLLNLGPEEPSEYSDEYFDHVAKAWSDAGVQKTFRRSNEFQLIDSAAHFLNRIDEIRKVDYIPSVSDILFCRIKTVTISAIEFSVPVPKSYGGGSANFLMYDVGGQRGERKKWIQVFDGIQAILFLIAASDFDLTLREDEHKNRLQDGFDVFKDIYCSRFVRDAGLIVFLNKQDLLRQKISDGKKIEKYFPDYKNYKPEENDEYERARLFMKQKILDISNIELTSEFVGFIPGINARTQEVLPPRPVYIHYTIATDTGNIKRVFDTVHEIIIKMNIDIIGLT